MKLYHWDKMLHQWKHRKIIFHGLLRAFLIGTVCLMSFLAQSSDISQSELPSLVNRMEIEATALGGTTLLMYAPKTMQPVHIDQTEITSEGMAPIAGFQHVSNPAIVLQLQASRLEFTISAINWLAYYIAEMGWDGRNYTDMNPKMAAAEAQLEINGAAFDATIVAHIIGPYIFIVQGLAPSGDMPALAPLLTVCARSFSIEQMPDPNLVEQLAATKIGGGHIVTLPASWAGSLAEGSTALKSAADFYRQNGGNMTGWIRAKFISSQTAQSLEAAYKTFLSELAETDILLTASAGRNEIEGDGPYHSGFVEQFEGQIKQGNKIYANMLAIEASNGLILIGSVGPSEEVDFLEWAYNEEAFKYALTLLRMEQ